MIVSFRTFAATSPAAAEHNVRGSRMGRGRQKAKHTKIARDLKYFSPDTNYNALEAEIGSHSGEPHAGWSEEDFAEEDSHR
jgi:hypothetical protein